jgi:predicted PurR-regulated permease PerM
MAEQKSLTGGSRILLSLASFVIIVAGLKAASAILVPFIVAFVLAIMGGPAVFWLKSKKVSSGAAVILVVLGMIGVLSIVGYVVGSSVNEFVQVLPSFDARLREILQSWIEWLDGKGVKVSGARALELLDPGAAMSLAARLLNSVGGLLTNAFLIILTVIFTLLEASSFPGKVKKAFGSGELTLVQFEEFARKLNRYVALKTVMSLGTGLCVGLWVTIAGVDFAILWALLAFLLNYIPNLGSIFAAVPAVLMALVQYGLGHALMVAVGYLVINVVISNFLEPRFMGRGLGLSTLAVFLSLVVWAWIFGPLGMLLAVPLTITLKIAFESGPGTHWIGVLLGPPAEDEVEAPDEDPKPTNSETS